MTETTGSLEDEGWGVIRPGDRRAHYYRGGTSLCRRVGFYRGPLDPDTGRSPDDCAACRKALDKNPGNPAAGHDSDGQPGAGSQEGTRAEATPDERKTAR